MKARPNVNWSVAPKEALWWAMDADGRAYWYSAPDVKPFTDFWFSEPEEAPTFGFDGDWLASLTARPKTKE